MYSCVICFVLITKTAQSQSVIKDIVYDKKHYNYCQYYYVINDRIEENEKYSSTILCLGNIKDSVKNGRFVYFYTSGYPFAMGKFKNGIKTGTWKIYYDYGNFKNKIHYHKKQKVNDCVVISKKISPIIIDTLHINNTIEISKIAEQKQNVYSPTIFLD